MPHIIASGANDEELTAYPAQSVLHLFSVFINQDGTYPKERTVRTNGCMSLNTQGYRIENECGGICCNISLGNSIGSQISADTEYQNTIS